jgi:hypothetical protein
MKLSYTDRTGLNTTGTYGAIILAGVVFEFLSVWWLLPSIFLWLMAIGWEQGRSR